MSKCVAHGIFSLIGVYDDVNVKLLDDLIHSFFKRNMIPPRFDLLPPLIKFCNEDYRRLFSTPEKLALSEFCTTIMEFFLPTLAFRPGQIRSVVTSACKVSNETQVNFQLVSTFLPVIAKACSSFFSVWKTKNSMTIIIRQTKRFAFVSRMNHACNNAIKKKKNVPQLFIFLLTLFLMCTCACSCSEEIQQKENVSLQVFHSRAEALL